jgi:hypothetical protein
MSSIFRVEEYAYLFHAGFLLGLFFDCEDRGDMFLRKFGSLSTEHTEHRPLHNHNCEDLKSCKMSLEYRINLRRFIHFESRGTHGHILLSLFRDSANLEGQASVFVSPRKRVAQ